MKTKILALPLILLAVGCRDRYEGQAGAASSPSPGASPYSTYPSPGTAESGAGVAAVVVAVDPAGRTITLREVVAPGGAATGDSAGKRYNVSAGAASSLNDVQAGEQVFVVCETAAGAPGSGTTGSGPTSGPGSLANCAVITMLSEAGGSTGR
jgi:hypothetical protein